MNEQSNPSADHPIEALRLLHGQELWEFACWQTGNNEHDAWDIVQETWLRVLRALPGLKDKSNLRSFILTTASNLCKNYRFRDGKFNEHAKLKLRVEQGRLALPAQRETVLEELEELEERERQLVQERALSYVLHRCDLQPWEWRLYLLHIDLKKSATAIAALCGGTPTAVSGRLFRLKKKIHSHLNRLCAAEFTEVWSWGDDEYEAAEVLRSMMGRIFDLKYQARDPKIWEDFERRIAEIPPVTFYLNESPEELQRKYREWQCQLDLADWESGDGHQRKMAAALRSVVLKIDECSRRWNARGRWYWIGTILQVYRDVMRWYGDDRREGDDEFYMHDRWDCSRIANYWLGNILVCEQDFNKSYVELERGIAKMHGRPDPYLDYAEWRKQILAIYASSIKS